MCSTIFRWIIQLPYVDPRAQLHLQIFLFKEMIVLTLCQRILCQFKSVSVITARVYQLILVSRNSNENDNYCSVTKYLKCPPNFSQERPRSVSEPMIYSIVVWQSSTSNDEMNLSVLRCVPSQESKSVIFYLMSNVYFSHNLLHFA